MAVLGPVGAEKTSKTENFVPCISDEAPQSYMVPNSRISLEPAVLIYPMQSAPGVEMHVEPSKLKMKRCPIHLKYPPESVNHVTNRWTSL